MKIAVVFWSGTGNTEAMAAAVAAGAREAGAETELMSCDQFDANQIDAYDAFAFGCPAMGDEVLEESEFDPMFTQIEDKLAGKKVALFGSYGWGDGEWMREWEARCAQNGIVLAADSVICNEEPDANGVEECKQLGAKLA